MWRSTTPLDCLLAGWAGLSLCLLSSAVAAQDLSQGLSKLAEQLAPNRPQLGETLLLGLSVNGVPQDRTIRALRVREGLAVPQQLWDELHLRLPLLAPRVIDGEVHVLLGSDDRWRWRIDEASQTLLIDAPAAAFRGQRMDMDAQANRVTMASDWGGFANYDLQWQRRQGGSAAGSSSTDALLELGLFTPQGPVNSTALYRNDGRLVRLDSRWVMDQPQRMARLSVGDSVSQPGSWGRALRFAGLQWGTDFSLRPGFLSFPLPSLRGEAALPSTVDVFVNNSQRLQGRLQPGPFDISDMPVVTGQGEIRTVVRDLLGREQVVTQPYYVSPSLLKPGLRAFSIELGALRQDYGLVSDRYGQGLLIATERLGLNDRFTRELRAELMRTQQTVGASGIWLWPSLGTANLSLAASHSRKQNNSQGSGWMAAAGIDRQAQSWSGSLQLRKTSADFVQAGDSTGPLSMNAPGMSVAAAIGRSWAGGNSLGLSYVRQTGISGLSGSAARLVSINYGRDLRQMGYLGLFLLRDLGGSRSGTVGLSWNYALDDRTSSGASLVRNDAGSNSDGSRSSSQQLQVQVQRNAPLGDGVGYQLVAESGGRQLGVATLQTEVASLNAGVAHSRGALDLRGGASGGVAWMAGSTFASRRIEGGLALVEVADFPDVRVWQDNQVVGRTDARGRALLSGLRGYQSNRVGIDSSDLPFDAELAALEVILTPAGRSAARVNFPVLHSRAASFRLVDVRGQVLPPGTVMQQLAQSGPPRSFPVGLEGRAYLAGLAEESTVSARWPDGECHFQLKLPAQASDLPDLGTVVCK